MSESSGRLYRLFATVFLIVFATSAVQPMLPLYLNSHGASLLDIGMILSISPLAEIFVLLPLSELSRRIGKEAVVAFACACQALCLVLYASVSNVVWFYLIGVLFSMVEGGFAPAAYGIVVSASSRRQLGEMMGKYFFSVALGMTLGPLVSGILVQNLGFRNAFLIMAPLPAAGILVLLHSKDKPPQIDGKNEGSFFKSARPVLSNRTMLFVLIVELLYSLTVGSCNTLLPTYFSENALLSPSSIGLLFALRGLSNAALRLPAGRLSDRLGLKRTLTSALIFTTGALVLLAVTRDFVVLSLAMVIFGGGWGVRVVSEAALLAERLPRDYSVVSWATVFISLNIGMFLGTFLTGLASFTAKTNVLYLAAAILVPAILASVFIPPGNPSEKQLRSIQRG